MLRLAHYFVNKWRRSRTRCGYCFHSC